MIVNKLIANKLHYAVAAALLTSLALAGCKKDANNPDTTPAATTPAPMTPAPTPTQPTDQSAMGQDSMGQDNLGQNNMGQAAAVNVSKVTLGTSAGADKSIANPMTSFATKDPIVVSIATNGAASNADVNARLVYQDGQVAGERSQTINTTGMETTNITFNNANGWPAGSYTAEVSINGDKVQSTPFTVK